MGVSRQLPQWDVVVCHSSQQMTAQELLVGKPLLMLPMQLEWFLITRRVVRMGAALGVTPEVRDADFAAALSTIVARCEAAISGRQP
ncbi:MAG TPA: hypothetical protein VNF69_02010 [Burkholderiales bacterium]|nr:hypothetical protein [Burkholderiales bacterium]